MDARLSNGHEGCFPVATVDPTHKSFYGHQHGQLRTSLGFPGSLCGDAAKAHQTEVRHGGVDEFGRGSQTGVVMEKEHLRRGG